MIILIGAYPAVIVVAVLSALSGGHPARADTLFLVLNAEAVVAIALAMVLDRLGMKPMSEASSHGGVFSRGAICVLALAVAAIVMVGIPPTVLTGHVGFAQVLAPACVVLAIALVGAWATSP